MESDFLGGNVCYWIKIETDQRQKIFMKPNDYKFFLNLLKKYKAPHSASLFAFCLLPARAYLILQSAAFENIENFVEQTVNSLRLYLSFRYPDVALQELRGSYKPISKDQQLFSLIKYLEFLPVSERLTLNPAAYTWSSCAYRVLEDQALIDKVAATETKGGVR